MTNELGKHGKMAEERSERKTRVIEKGVIEETRETNRREWERIYKRQRKKENEKTGLGKKGWQKKSKEARVVMS